MQKADFVSIINCELRCLNNDWKKLKSGRKAEGSCNNQSATKDEND